MNSRIKFDVETRWNYWLVSSSHNTVSVHSSSISLSELPYNDLISLYIFIFILLVFADTRMAFPIWIVTLLCPTIGTIICNIMWSAALPAILIARKELELGSLNPMPFLAMIFNCIGWTIYSMQLRDFFIFFSNCTGLTLGLFYILTSLRLMGRKDDKKSKEMVELCEGLLVFIVGFWCLMVRRHEFDLEMSFDLDFDFDWNDTIGNGCWYYLQVNAIRSSKGNTVYWFVKCICFHLILCCKSISFLSISFLFS